LPENALQLLALTNRIVASYTAAHPVDATALPGLIQDVRRALAELRTVNVVEKTRATSFVPPAIMRPAVDIRKSVYDDHLVCLEDGKKVTMLKRHLMTAHGMTPEQYRAKWYLPRHYPMVAPNYAKVRSGLAKDAGLGRNGRRKKEPG
jgi:predicted transcriptional regulator